MDAMSVEVAAGTVVVLGGAWVGVPGQDLGVAEGNVGVEGVGDGCVPQRVGAAVTRDASGLRDADDHPADVTTLDELA
jgi:hypothetical protein